MYERFFGLDEPPFRLTPDPRYFFLSRKHRDTLGHLIYGIREGAGFVAITGEIGAGKTTLLRKLLREEDDATRYAYVLNPVLTGVELLQEINHELGLPVAESRREMLSHLNAFLLERKREGKSVVLVVDEAQALDGAILEQLRMSSGQLRAANVQHLLLTIIGQTVFPFASGEFGREVLGKDVFDKAEVARRKQEVRDLLRYGLIVRQND